MTDDENPQEEKSLFNPGKADWLREKGGKALDESQQALLLAMTQLETQMGRELSPEEAAALEALAGQLDGYDPNDITQAIQKVVSTPADPKRKLAWPELKRKKH